LLSINFLTGMKKGRVILFFLIVVLGAVVTVANPFNSKENVQVVQTTEYSNINTTIQEKVERFGVENVLVVLDIDNTILTSDVDLGSDVWYQWQRNKLEIKPTEEQKVECLFEDAIGLLYELGTMHLTDTSLPSFINDWQEQNLTLFALTSRSPRYRTATERELIKQGLDLSTNAIRPRNQNLPVYRYNLKREMSYMNGVMMTSGMNKGEMLQHILEKTDRIFHAVVFVDDSKKNVDALFNEFKPMAIDFTIFHYTKIEEERIKKFGSVLTQEQANKMDADWKALNTTLNEIFPNRTGRCVSIN
jgi:hypothetical protein